MLKPSGQLMCAEAALAEKIEALLCDPVASLGMQLLEVQYRLEGQWVLRLLIDRPEGVGTEQCSRVSALAGSILEAKNLLPHPFSLEVSSPGIFRKLHRPKDFAQASGKTVRLMFLAEDEGAGQILRGSIAATDETALMLKTDVETLRLPFERIRKARLDPESIGTPRSRLKAP